MIHKQVLFNECQLLLKEGAEAEEEEGGEGGRRRKGKEGEDDGEGERRDRMWGEKEWGAPLLQGPSRKTLPAGPGGQ